MDNLLTLVDLVINDEPHYVSNEDPESYSAGDDEKDEAFSSVEDENNEPDSGEEGEEEGTSSTDNKDFLLSSPILSSNATSPTLSSSNPKPPPWSLLTRHIIPSLQLSQKSMYSKSGVGSVLWDGAIILSHLISNSSLQFSITDRKVLELGSGTGAAGLSCALHGASEVVLTDQLITIQNITIPNHEINKHVIPDTCHVTCVEADWLKLATVIDAGKGCDVVIAADCVYEGEGGVNAVTDAFINALESVVYICNIPDVVVVYKIDRTDVGRGLATGFREKVNAMFEVIEVDEEVLCEEHRGLGQSVLYLMPKINRV